MSKYIVENASEARKYKKGYKISKSPEIREYFLKILNKSSDEIIPLMKDKFDIELTKRQIQVARSYYKIKCEVRPNKRPILHEIEDKDGYIWIKVQEYKGKGKSNKTYIHKHQYIYEQKYGKIPKGYCVVFLDQDKRNFDINNLALVKRNILLQAANSGMLTKDKDLTKTGLIITELINKRCELAKENGFTTKHGIKFS